jgi:predicted exporter
MADLYRETSICRIISADNSKNMSFVAMKIDINTFLTKYRFGVRESCFAKFVWVSTVVCLHRKNLRVCVCVRLSLLCAAVVVFALQFNCTGAFVHCRGLLAVQEVEEPSGVGGTLVSR